MVGDGWCVFRSATPSRGDPPTRWPLCRKQLSVYVPVLAVSASRGSQPPLNGCVLYPTSPCMWALLMSDKDRRRSHLE